MGGGGNIGLVSVGLVAKGACALDESGAEVVALMLGGSGLEVGGSDEPLEFALG
jgi:hypothetical protein